MPDWKNAYAGLQKKGEAEFPPACLHYVLQATRLAFRERGNKGLTPNELIGVFRQRLRRDFGPLLAAVLEDWGLRAPEDLGKAVLLLGRAGCLIPGPEDTLAAYGADSRGFSDA
jgi:uncharacterized repeat protein (TIGR04138 family)